MIKSELALHKTDNLTKSELRNLQREISFSLFPNDPEPIGIIDSGYLPYFNDIGITDNIIYSGKAYFVDHALFSHPEIKTEEFEHLLDTLSEPDLVKLDDRHGSITLLFIKKFNKFFVEVIRADEEKRLVLHKTFYYKDKVPQKALPDVEPVRVVPEGGHSSIDPA